MSSTTIISDSREAVPLPMAMVLDAVFADELLGQCLGWPHFVLAVAVGGVDDGGVEHLARGVDDGNLAAGADSRGRSPIATWPLTGGCISS